MAKGPPLPPRNPSEASLSGASTTSITSPLPRADTVHLTPNFQAEKRPQPHPYSDGFDDPRASSTQSLKPVESLNGRRTLLLIYIHGFLGDETSFQSFPAHVHNILTATLSETHIVYSKIYPRYKSRKKINFARDDFSRWLQPHESPNTDIILVGHSLGGILAAEVVLIPGIDAPLPFKHNILSLVAFDVPFLGIHPGVVGTGIASLFRSPPEDPSPTSATSSSFPEADPEDPNYNPSYPNDVHLNTRIGKLNKAFYFFNKHWGELNKAAGDYVTSHLEHGGVLADYPALKRRYVSVRELEDVDPFQHPQSRTKRVRFVNYYSASTGRIKERSPSPSKCVQQGDGGTSPLSPSMQNLSLQSTTTTNLTAPSSNPSPRLSLEEHRSSGEIIRKSLEELEPRAELSDTERVADHEHEESKQPAYTSEFQSHPLSQIETNTTLPSPSSTPLSSLSIQETKTSVHFDPLPPLPPPPAPFDENNYTGYPDPGSLSIARKEHDRLVKAHMRMVKDREKTLKEREKFVAKREKSEKKAAEKEAAKLQKEQLKGSATLNREADLSLYSTRSEAQDIDTPTDSSLPVSRTTTNNPSTTASKQKKQKDRTFCTLPSKDPQTGLRDAKWVRVYMEGIDEVVAHTSMFKMSMPTYARLVEDTAGRIEEWVQEDATRRAVVDAQYH